MEAIKEIKKLKKGNYERLTNQSNKKEVKNNGNLSKGRELVY